MHLPGAQLPKPMHPAPKLCTPGAGCTLNFKHCLFCLFINVYAKVNPFVFTENVRMKYQLLLLVFLFLMLVKISELILHVSSLLQGTNV